MVKICYKHSPENFGVARHLYEKITGVVGVFNSEKPTELRQIEVDLPREGFIQKHSQAKLLLKIYNNNSRHLTDYTQGDFTGRSVVKCFLLKNLTPERASLDTDELEITENNRVKHSVSIDFIYLNDNNQACGFSFSSRTDIQGSWTVCVLEDIFSGPSDVTCHNFYGASSPLLPYNDEAPGDVQSFFSDETEIGTEIEQCIKCTGVWNIVKLFCSDPDTIGKREVVVLSSGTPTITLVPNTKTHPYLEVLNRKFNPTLLQAKERLEGNEKAKEAHEHMMDLSKKHTKISELYEDFLVKVEEYREASNDDSENIRGEGGKRIKAAYRELSNEIDTTLDPKHATASRVALRVVATTLCAAFFFPLVALYKYNTGNFMLFQHTSDTNKFRALAHKEVKEAINMHNCTSRQR